MRLVESFNRKVPYALRLVLVLLVGLGLVKAAIAVVGPAHLAVAKVSGRAHHCSWTSVLRVVLDHEPMWETNEKVFRSAKVVESDEQLRLERVHTHERDFWVQTDGEQMDGRALVAHLLAEQTWMGQQHPDLGVRSGDIVADCGAHVGIFTHRALQRGAGKVIAIEPHPLNIECLRRNFAAEIAAGKVIVYPKGVWSSESTLALSIAKKNSGMSSVVLNQGGESIQVPLTTLDKMVAELNLPRLDFIKMDIEGAEREALKGGAETIRKFRPQLQIEAYHRPDDMEVLPRIVLAAQPGYRVKCGPCDPVLGKPGYWVPHDLRFF